MTDKKANSSTTTTPTTTRFPGIPDNKVVSSKPTMITEGNTHAKIGGIEQEKKAS